MGKSAILRQTQEYLASRYSANFSISSIDRVSNIVGPLPSITSSYHWEMIVESDQFPGEQFTVFCRQDSMNQWKLSDNYCNILLRDEAKAYFSSLIQPYIEDNYVVDIFWGDEVWPDEISEGNSIEEWLKAGGNIWGLYIYLQDIDPLDTSCKPVSLKIFEETPSVQLIKFYGLTNDGFESAANSTSAQEIWNNNPKYRLGRIQYLQEENP